MFAMKTVNAIRLASERRKADGNEDVPTPIGKNHALKKYDQFALNTSCFYPSCAISRNFCYKNNE